MYLKDNCLDFEIDKSNCLTLLRSDFEGYVTINELSLLPDWIFVAPDF